jgi:hypothetical protein
LLFLTKLFSLGLYDSISIDSVLSILRQYIPIKLYTKLKKFTSTEYSRSMSLNWIDVKQQLEKIDFTICSGEILKILNSADLSDKNVHIFHIENNDGRSSQEPTHSNMNNLIYRFLYYLNKRNIIASILKYILLYPIIHKLTTSQLTQTYKGIFSQMLKRLNEIIFESILTAFNGSNYDNYLIINHLIIILTKLKHKIHIFKKGASISTVHIHMKQNLPHPQNISQQGYIKTKKVSKKKNNFVMSLYIKDIRNLVASHLSLDKLGKLFNLPVSKCSFPYNQATSIERLKSLDSLYPYDDSFWRDSFTSKTITLDERLQAQSIFDAHHFQNLYQYSTYYLIQDCVLLHSIVHTLFHSYLKQSINIFLRRNFSQSSLSFQEFFITAPSKQILQTLAPKRIIHTFSNYFIRSAVTGGICTSFVHGDIDQNTIINEHMNYLNCPNLDPNTWPNFNNISPWSKNFCQTPSGICTIDIRSLYPSACLKKIPIGTPFLYNRFIQSDFQNLVPTGYAPNLYVAGFCENVQTLGDHQTDMMKLVNKPPRGIYEFMALQYYLSTLPANIEIVRFQSTFTALGQLYLSHYPLDGYLAYKLNNHLYIKLIQYQSTYYHGHMPTCSIQNDPHQHEKAQESLQTKENIVTLFNHFIQHFQLTNVSFEYVEISNCQFESHRLPNMGSTLFPYQKQYTYLSFLNKIFNKSLTGFVVVRNLEIKKNQQNPIFGFLIQKVEYNLKKLSPYTQSILKHFVSNSRVVSLHKTDEFMVISTDYLCWLQSVFGFENTPDIYHAILFKMDYYLRNAIETKLKMRKEIKEHIKNELDTEKKQVLEIQAELIKLLLNSCYGFTLCNVTSTKFKSFRNAWSLPKHKNRLAKLKTVFQLDKKVFLNEYRLNIPDPFETMLGHVGSSILFSSKIILLKRLYFLLKYLNPTQAQLLYMDTDSAHFLLKYPQFIDNVDTNLQNEFNSLVDKHFESGIKISGIWVKEGFFTKGTYIGEKCYLLYDSLKNTHLTHMKGLNSYFQQQFITQNIDIKQLPNISYNLFYKAPDYTIYKSSNNKDIFSNYIPIKRYFISPTGSLPLKL